MDGTSCQIGGSLGIPVEGVPLSAGGDFNIIPNELEDTVYYGATSNIGFGTPGGELHVEWGETRTLKETRFNLFELFDISYFIVMKW